MANYLKQFLNFSVVIITIGVLSDGTAQAFGTTTLVICPHQDLQAAINGADPGDTITIRGVCFGRFTVGKDLRLVGARHHGAILHANAPGTVLTIEERATVVVKKLTITNGKGEDDGTTGGIIVNGVAQLCPLYCGNYFVWGSSWQRRIPVEAC